MKALRSIIYTFFMQKMIRETNYMCLIAACEFFKKYIWTFCKSVRAKSNGALAVKGE